MAQSLKKKLGRAIPYPVISLGRRIIHFGPHQCMVCEHRHGRRLNSGYGHPILEELQVVGGQMRRADCCPICHSSARERLIWLYLSRHFLDAGKKPRTAHFAPEKGLSARLADRLGPAYQAFDLEPARYRHLRDVRAADLQALPLSDGQTDLFLCNHVLEHVHDLLSKALSEVRRVLASDGLALMQVPIALALGEMRDGGQTMTRPERIRFFGQDDHVRLFNRDSYLTTLEEAGFRVTPWNAFEMDPQNAWQWSLDPLEELMLIRRRD